jgi:hypothetical protein
MKRLNRVDKLFISRYQPVVSPPPDVAYASVGARLARGRRLSEPAVGSDCHDDIPSVDKVVKIHSPIKVPDDFFKEYDDLRMTC